jgi:acyl carrier protein
MTTSDVHELVRSAIADIAPDVDPSDVDADLHDDLGLDSMDLLNLTAVVVQRSGVEIPERDLAALRTLRHLEAYLDARLR